MAGRRFACPLPAALRPAGRADVLPRAEGGGMPHLRFSPVLRVAGEGVRDAFVLATRARAANGALESEAVVLTAVRPVGDAGWALDDAACIRRAF